MIGRAFFRRRREPEAESWAIGDVAECICNGPWWRNGDELRNGGPAKGERHAVAYLRDSKFTSGKVLGFAKFAPDTFDARAFRKVRPQPDAPIAASAMFTIALLSFPGQVR